MAIIKGKKRVTISMPEDKYKAFKKMSVDENTTLSEVLVSAGTSSYDEWLKSQKQ